jgi:murein DD-endopeptidase MepM/ murein hydrolase activator NlpD
VTAQPAWLSNLHAALPESAEVTLVITKRENIEYLTLSKRNIDEYLVSQRRASKRYQQVVLGLVFSLLAGFVGVFAYTEGLSKHIDAQQAQVRVLESAITTAAEQLVTFGLVESFDNTSALDLLDELAGQVRQHHLAINFLAESTRRYFPDLVSSKLAAIDSSGLSEHLEASVPDSIGSTGIGGTVSADLDLLEKYLDDPVLALLAQLNEIDVYARSLPSTPPLSSARVSSRFGMRRHPVSNRFEAHKGVDFVSYTESNVVATHDGVVVFAGRDGSFGNVVRLQSSDGLVTLYAHLSKLLVSVGDQVAAGAVLGIVGNTGLSTSRHLHYEISFQGIQLDPLRLMRLSNEVQQ